MQLHGRNALGVAYHEEYRLEPGPKRQFGVLEDRAVANGELGHARAALEATVGQAVNLGLHASMNTGHATGPAQIAEVGDAGGLVGQGFFKLAKVVEFGQHGVRSSGVSELCPYSFVLSSI